MDLFGQEFWREIPGYPNYEVSSCGRVRRTAGGPGARRGRILSQRLRSGKGDHLYFCVDLWHDCQRTSKAVHRLVARAFVPLPEGTEFDDFEVDHINGDNECNHAWNLRWATSEQNNRIFRFGAGRSIVDSEPDWGPPKG